MYGGGEGEAEGMYGGGEGEAGGMYGGGKGEAGGLYVGGEGEGDPDEEVDIPLLPVVKKQAVHHNAVG